MQPSLNPTVSLVMFVKDESKHIAEMLHSIAKQTYSVNQLIIVDNGSTDETINIIQQFTQRLPITILSCPNKNKTYACEMGLAYAQADYIGICAGDDVLLPNFVESMLMYLKKHALPFAYSTYIETNETLSNHRQIEKHTSYTLHEVLKSNQAAGYLFAQRKVIDTLLPFPNNLLFEDWYMVVRLALHHGKVNLNPTPLFYYRRHQGSSSTNSQHSYEKFRYLTRRNIQLMQVLMKQPDTQSIHTPLTHRLALYELYLNPSFFKGCKLLLSPHLTWKEKIKALFTRALLHIKFINVQHHIAPSDTSQ